MQRIRFNHSLTRERWNRSTALLKAYGFEVRTPNHGWSFTQKNGGFWLAHPPCKHFISSVSDTVIGKLSPTKAPVVNNVFVINEEARKPITPSWSLKPIEQTRNTLIDYVANSRSSLVSALGNILKEGYRHEPKKRLLNVAFCLSSMNTPGLSSLANQVAQETLVFIFIL